MTEHNEPTPADDDAAFWARVSWILNAAMDTLRHENPQDFAQRIEAVRVTNNHGITVFDDPERDNAVLFMWGGRKLVSVPRRVFADEAYFEGLSLTTVKEENDK